MVDTIICQGLLFGFYLPVSPVTTYSQVLVQYMHMHVHVS